MIPLEAISLEKIRAARERIASSVPRTPLVRLPLDEHEDADVEIHLKLENLQPIGSFKLRGAGNAIAAAEPRELERGLYTASAGNMAQGVAWNAQRLGVRCDVIVPDHAPAAKLEAIARLGAHAIPVPFDDWWRVIETHEYPGMEGHFIHPVCNADVIAGNGTIGLEIVEDLPEVDVVLVPYGGGALSCGIASAVKGVRPETEVYGCEVETAAPLAASFAAGRASTVEYRKSFVDGIGGKGVLPEMWELARVLLDGSRVVAVGEVADAVRTLATRCHVIAEGAGATPLAAALKHERGRGLLRVACVVSGGNIDPGVLGVILQGGVP